jgi:hypothetical protein
MMAVSSEYRAKSTWWEGVDKQLTDRLKRRGEIISPYTTPVLMDVVAWQAASNVLPCRLEERIFTRYEGKLGDEVFNGIWSISQKI